MNAATCAPLFAFAALFLVAPARAQTDLPPIFVPRPAPPEPPAPLRTGAPAVSEHARALLNATAQRVLASAAPFEGPASAPRVSVDSATGATVMAPVFVRETPLQDSELRRPEPRLLHFERVGGDKARRIAGGVTAPLYHAWVGGKELQVDFNILNGAGNGVDHGRDFTRVELAFSFKW